MDNEISLTEKDGTERFEVDGETWYTHNGNVWYHDRDGHRYSLTGTSDSEYTTWYLNGNGLTDVAVVGDMFDAIDQANQRIDWLH